MTALSALTDWANFYVITGSAAAGLMGLTFVVIALAANGRGMTSSGMRAFVTPTIVHFGTVLALAAFLSVPRQNLTSLSLAFGAAGVAGLIYGVLVGVSMRRLGSRYVPVGEDWLWHVSLPTLVYGALLVMAFLIRRRVEQSLYGVATISMLLLFIGIHNAWDVAVSISVSRKPDPSKTPEPRPAAGSETAAQDK
ncbi:MAG TPA: hypothetical protein VN461_23490 [Vicinamibacteria bacterium]|jgi:hypothetical protein|nr:hypothetical protein [Vicinamibacteria bacterium]